MKMGTTVSPWRYDAVACRAPQSANVRRPAILRYASRAAIFPIWEVVRSPVYSGPSRSIPGRRDAKSGNATRWSGGRWIGVLSDFTFDLRPARRVVVAQELLQSLDIRRARTLAPDENGLSPVLVSRKCVDRQ